MPIQDINTTLIQHLKTKYFNDAKKQLSLTKGAYLITQNEINNRLYLVLEGSVTGHLISEAGAKHEVFQTHKNMFVGVHSFFSAIHIGYANVVATTNSRVAYIEYEELIEKHAASYHQDFLPLIVNELSVRQRFSKDMMLEKEAALKQLYHNEKMSTLGQMAAGLAHELNNAIGVLNGNSEWIAKSFEQYLQANIDNDLYADFEYGFNEGYSISSQQVRDDKKKIETKFKFPAFIAKRLAKLGYNKSKIKALPKNADLDKLTSEKIQIWEMGVALRDMLISSKHATHVLKSIKELSASDQIRNEVDINDSIKEALTLLKKVVAPIQLDLKLDKLPSILANKGELIQIWVNIIKNACESMLSASIENPVLLIKAKHIKDQIIVEITDNGPGMPIEIQEKIFQPNFTTKKDGLSFGLGLGLSIVLKLIDNYNGTIEVNSKVGKTTFTIKIPIA